MTDTGGIVQSEDASDSRVVTLVFTDIEGSTRLVDSLGADYADVLSRHQELIRGIVAKYNGMDRGTQGDSFFLVYDDPRDALATAIEIHRGLNTRTWHKDVQVGVRIGLHTGEVTFLRSEIVGLNVHRAARVCDAGHGGQIVVTQDVQTAVGDTTGLGFSFEPLGRHRLKDLRYPEVLFGVKASGLDRDFKPVRSLDSRHDNLTPLQTTIVGRDTELETLRDLLDNHTGRLLTLLGPGGIGKSSIAHRLAEIERDAFPHGVHFVDLSGVSEPEFVFPSIAQAIGVRDFPNRPLEDDIVGDIGVNRRLLVLDTMEHLLEARTAVGHLIDRCPQLRIVVTSRSALGLNSEKLVRVGALELPEPGQPDADQNPAVRLFVNRILEADPDFKPTPETLDTIVRIVRRLEGVPLAMELAAARLILLSPGELLARLDERFKLLRSSSKDVARHRTLRGAIEWSDELLDEEERDAFHRLAVFAGGFRFRDGEDVLEGVDGYAGDPMDLIASLVSKSLIERSTSSGEPRFVMLDMIREFAIEKLQKGGAHDEMQALHCDHYADIAEKSGANALRHDQRVHVTKLVEEVDNIRAALHYALEIEDAARVARFLRALQWYWFTQAQVTEAFTWTARAADLAARTPDKVSAGIIHEAVCTVNMGAGDYAAAFPHGQAAVASYEAANNPSGQARANLLVALCGAAVGEFEDPSPMIMSSIERFNQDGDAYYSALGLIILGEGARMAGMKEPAEECYMNALTQLDAFGDTFWKGALKQNIAHFRLANEDPDGAAELFSEAYDLGDAYDYEIVRTLAVAGFAGVSLQRGDAETAARLLGGVDANLERIGVQFEPADAADVQVYVSATKTALGDAAYADLNKQGAGTPWTAILEESRRLGL